MAGTMANFLQPGGLVVSQKMHQLAPQAVKNQRDMYQWSEEPPD